MKGVFCKIVPDKDMPVDELGRVADVILDPISVPNRTNLGRLYEFYMNDVLEQTEMKLKQMVDFKPGMSLESFSSIDPFALFNALEYLLKLVGILAPKQEEFLRSLSEDEKIEYLYETLNEHITIHMPPDTEVDVPHTVLNIIEQSEYKPYVGKIKYTGADGNPCVTDSDIRIADLYIMLLDKIADDWSSVSVSKLQHHGIISANKLVKHDYPYRCSPVRVQGEDENRILAGYTTPENVAELIDRNNNPLTMRAIVHNILDSDKPTNIYRLVDRTRIPYGSNKPLQLINHIFGTCGFRPTYRRDRD